MSDVLSTVSKDMKFDLIYWNYPFNHSFKEYPSEGLSLIELAARDPGYVHLDQLLSTAKDYLKPNGFILLSFSLVIGNTKLMKEIAKKNGWIDSVWAERAANEAENLPHLNIIKL